MFVTKSVQTRPANQNQMSMSRYNIAHIMPWPSIGGVEQATLRIAQAVEGDQFRSVAFCLDGPSPVRDMFSEAGFETASYTAVDPSYRHPKTFLRASLQLAHELKRQEVDLVHCSDLLAGYYAAVAGRLARRPVLCHIRCRFDEISRRDQSFLRAVNKFVFVSRNTWKNFGYKVTARRGTVVYDGIETDGVGSSEAKEGVRRELGVPDAAKVVGMVARVEPHKDYATLAKAAARIVAVHPDVRFLIVGEHSRVATYREHYEEVKQMLVDNNVAPYFIFTGFRSDVSRLTSAMDIFVLSTHSEGLPLVILEAMAHAVPVVATAVDGIPEIVIDEKTGLLHSHQDDAELAIKILSLLNSEARATALGEAGRKLVEMNFTVEKFAMNMSNLYRGILSCKGEHTFTHKVSGGGADSIIR